MSFRIRFQGDVPHSRQVGAECEGICAQLSAGFPEASSFEVSLGRTGVQFDVHVHVTGRHVSLAAKARQRVLGEALHAAFARAERQLRKRHDKQIYVRRREVQRQTGWIAQ